jgi:hypothetical protein
VKLATFALLVSGLGTVSAIGQDLSLTSATVSLTSAANTTIFSTMATTVMGSIGCTVSGGPVVGSVSAELKTTIGNGAGTVATYTLYSSGYTWPATLYPFLTWSTTRDPSGSQVYIGGVTGDSFLIPFNNATATNGLKVEVDVTSAGTGGTLTCEVLVLHS